MKLDYCAETNTIRATEIADYPYSSVVFYINIAHTPSSEISQLKEHILKNIITPAIINAVNTGERPLS